MITLRSLARHPLLALVLSLAIASSSVLGATKYVSKGATGANDGTSWANAWNEFNQIAWGSVTAGDTILLDGGTTRKIYTTPLVVGTSGTSGSPITIRVATEAGRNGKVEIFGGRTAILPFSDYVYVFQSATYSPPQTALYNNGVDIIGRSYITIDGNRWGGIKVYGFAKFGVAVSRFTGTPVRDSSFITIRNIESCDNGRFLFWDYTSSSPSSVLKYSTDGRGVSYAGNNLVFDRLDVHDNGQDQFQNAGGLTPATNTLFNVTFSNSWGYNSRANTVTNTSSAGAIDDSKHDGLLNTGDVWNWHQHTDGIQLYDGGVVTGLKISDNIFGPGLMHNLLLGDDHGYPTSTWASVQGAEIINTLLVSHDHRWVNVPLFDLSPKPELPATGWTINHVTFHAHPTYSSRTLTIRVATDHLISNSIFVNKEINVSSGETPAVENNIQWNVPPMNVTLGATLDPMFAAPGNGGVAGGIALGTGFSDWDFTPTNTAGAINLGSRITTVNQLLGRGADLALGKAATTSAQVTGNEGSKAVDTSNTTHWRSTATYPQWLRVDLGSVQTISQTEVRPFSSRPYKFKIETSTDGTNYTLVVDNTHNTRGYPHLKDAFNPIAARYVRLTVTGAYTDVTNVSQTVTDADGASHSVTELNVNNGYSGGETSIVALKVFGTLPYLEDFEDSVADGFEHVTGTWAALTDGTQVYRSLPTQSLARAVVGESSWTNYAVESDVKVTSWGSTAYRTAGFSARYADTNNYYLFTYDMNGGLSIRKKVAGTLTSLANNASFPFALGTLYRFKAVLQGTKLEFYVNGNLELTATDSAFTQGRAGFHTAYADARFDNVRIGRVATLIDETFEDSVANGWSVIGGAWNITTDGTKVYNTSSTDSLSRAVVGVPSWQNYSLQANVKVNAFPNATYKTAGLLARYQDTNNYYLFVHDGGTQLKVMRKLNGTLTTLASKAYTLSLGTSYIFRAIVDGSELRFYVNGALELSASDNALTEGRLGLLSTYADGRFDNVTVISR